LFFSGAAGRVLGLKDLPSMRMWRAVDDRSRIMAATTALGNNEYQSVAALLAVVMRLLPALSVMRS
jgi:hypothetical protein